MKKRFFATVLTLALSAVMLMGCGSSPAEAETDPANIPAEFAEPAGSDGSAIPDDSTAETTSNTYVVNEQDEAITQFPNDNGMDDDFGRPPEEDLVSWDVEAGEEDVTEEVLVTGEVEGIIMLQADWGSDVVPTFTVSAINPDTGEYHTVSSFMFEVAAPIRADDYTVIPERGYTLDANYASLFNGDYTCMVATKTFLGNEEQHAGWVDQSGNFFDVTEALGEGRQSDFDDAVHFIAVGFTDDNYFVYTKPPYDIYYFVPLDNLVPEAILQVGNEDKRIMRNQEAWGWLKWNRPTCWLDNNTFLVDDTLEGQCGIASISEQSIRSYIPGESRTNWSGVVSPDGTQIAFLSASQKGTDEPAIFFTNISEETAPTKLETAYIPHCTRAYDAGNIALTVDYGYYYSSILEWR